MKWSEDEIRLLKALVSQNNKTYMSWKFVSQQIGTKTPRQCFDRYLYIQKSHEPFKEERRGKREPEGVDKEYYDSLLDQLRIVIESV